MKICRRCNVEKPASAYWKNKTKSDGLQAHCKECASVSFGVTLKCELCSVDFTIRHRNVSKRKTFLCPPCVGVTNRERIIARTKAKATYATLHTKGYKYLSDPSEKHGYKLEHRMVVEQHLGRPLRKDEVVHHIDLNPLNNHIDNLHVCSPAEHSIAHKTIDMVARHLLAHGQIRFNKEIGAYEPA